MHSPLQLTRHLNFALMCVWHCKGMRIARTHYVVSIVKVCGRYGLTIFQANLQSRASFYSHYERTVKRGVVETRPSFHSHMGLSKNAISREVLISLIWLMELFFYHIIDVRDKPARSDPTRSDHYSFWRVISQSPQKIQYFDFNTSLLLMSVLLQ